MRFAKQTEADLVIASLPVSALDAKRMGILKVDPQYFVTDFIEKPENENLLQPFQYADGKTPYLGSMGIYLFKREALLKLLDKDPREDFGKHLIPTKVSKGGVAAFLHHGYWEDIGTIQSFYEANMALTLPNPTFDCYNENYPIFSSRLSLPGPKIFDTKIKNSIICEGCLVEAAEVTHSILGQRSVIKKGCVIRDSYLLGNDFYNPPIKSGRLPDKLHIGENCIIQNAILDKHVQLGKGVQLINKNNLDHYNSEDVYIRDGIIIVPQGVSLPDGYTL
jgi:glucose-1-phosphate adenylyltransferase